MQQSADSLITRFRRGGLRLLRIAGRSLLTLLAALILGLVITLPLWYLASNFRGLFTALSLGALGLAVLLWAGARIRRRLQDAQAEGMDLRREILRVLKAWSIGLGCLAGIYGGLALSASGLWFVGIPLLLAAIAGVSLALAGKRRG